MPGDTDQADAGGWSISNDGGTTWNNWNRIDAWPTMGNSVGTSIHGVGDVIYAGSQSGFTISYDQGTTWTRRGHAYDQQIGYIGSVHDFYSVGSVVYAAADGGVVRSTDNGANWGVVLNSAHSVYGVHVDGNSVFAATSAGLKVSADGGLNWTTFTSLNGLASDDVRGVFGKGSSIYAASFFDGTRYGGLSVSHDFGATWTAYPPRLLRI
jgi:hypothetical protein